jgi:hypothetical protein
MYLSESRSGECSSAGNSSGNESRYACFVLDDIAVCGDFVVEPRVFEPKCKRFEVRSAAKGGLDDGDVFVNGETTVSGFFTFNTKEFNILS